ncbi:glycosyltransferase [Streptomyces virginiae]|uniref:glycosyltransferase n=1 Tax=Streptomyces virginiae TaxID=1961 RepID=UPI0035D62B75
MNDGRRVLIILPAWNEEDGLPSVLREFQQQLPYVDTLVVDDGSADSTAEVARAAGSSPGPSSPTPPRASAPATGRS